MDKYTISHLLDNKAPCVTIDNKHTIGQTIKLLHEKKIRSVPVIDDETKKCLGSVNVLDIACFIAHLDVGEEEILGATIFYFDKNITEVLDFFKTDYFMPMSPNYALSLAVQTFCRIAHCIPITDTSGKITNVLSQSDVVRFVSKNVSLFFGSNASRVPSQFGFVKGLKATLKVDSKSMVLKAITTLYENKVTALAIVNDDGTLLGNFSASDLGTLTVENFSTKIKEPVSKFIDVEKQEVIAVSESTSMGDIVKILADKKIHRVWIIDAEERPVGLVSLSDIMKFLRSSATTS